jgi:hypothetical protein
MILMQQAMNVASGRVAKILIESMTQVYEDWTDYALVALPERTAKLIAGPSAVWPVVTRDEIRASMSVEIVTAGIRGMRKAELEEISAAMSTMQQALQTEQAAMQMGYQFPSDAIGQRVAAALDLRIPGGLLRKQVAMQQAMLNAQAQMTANGGQNPALGGGQPGVQPGRPITGGTPALAQLTPAAAQAAAGGL